MRRLVSGALNQTDVEKKKSESKGCMRKARKRHAFPQVPSPPKLEAERCPAWSHFFPRQSKFQVPFQIWAKDSAYDSTV